MFHPRKRAKKAPVETPEQQEERKIANRLKIAQATHLEQEARKLEIENQYREIQLREARAASGYHVPNTLAPSSPVIE